MSKPFSSASVRIGIHSSDFHAAAIGGTDDERARACLPALSDVHLGQAQIRLAIGKAHLAQREFGSPVPHALRGLGRQLVRGVAEKEEDRGS